MAELGLKDLSRDLQMNCAISFCFYVYLMHYTCAVRFDVMENLKKNLETKQGLSNSRITGHQSNHIKPAAPSIFIA
jgi:hypothetical protein